jgi:DNA-binding NtrC family response regulator
MPIMLRPAAAGRTEEMSFNADRPFHEAKSELISRFEKSYLSDLLLRAKGNLSQAARIAGVERKHLYKLLDKHDLRPRKG